MNQGWKGASLAYPAFILNTFKVSRNGLIIGYDFHTNEISFFYLGKPFDQVCLDSNAWTGLPFKTIRGGTRLS